ncbi:MAG TPA: hypothetical protein VHP35_14470 [Terriglobia bacterium]|nr:hypothetical protein [Terriglobia bacterium]
MDKGYRVCAVNNLSQGTTRNIEQHFGCPRFEFVQEDVRNEAAILRLAQGATYLFTWLRSRFLVMGMRSIP